MAKGQFKCKKCSRTFTMAAHLARHNNTIHASGRSKKGRKKTSGKRAYRKRGGGTLGRPKGITSRLGLRGMSLEELSNVIDAARAEARRKLAGFSAIMR